jgi:hypothetical protein
MTKRPTLLADVTELRNVLHAMDAWGTAETRMPGDDTSPAAPDPVRVPRQGYRQLTANRASHPDRAQL